MHRIYARLPAHFYRISLHTETDKVTMALVPDQGHAAMIAKLLTENYGLRDGERFIITPTIVRPSNTPDSSHIELAHP